MRAALWPFVNRRVLIATLLVALALPAAARSPRSIVAGRALTQSVRVRIEKEGEVRRVASGVVVAARPGWARILTNAHVLAPVDGSSEFTVHVLSGDTARPARTLAMGQAPDLDLALIEVTGFDSLIAAELAEEGEVFVGDDVIVVGSPFGRGLTIAAGIVSQVESESMKTDAPIAYGSSGGGVFSVPGGKLVAIVEGYRTARVPMGKDAGFDVPMPGETFLAPLSKVRAFLARHSPPPPAKAASK